MRNNLFYLFLVIILCVILAAFILGVVLWYRKKTGKTAKPGPVHKAESPPVYTSKPAPKPTPKPAPPPAYPACVTGVFTVYTGNLAEFKKHGVAFSAAINDKTFSLQDRILFKNILLSISSIEPEGPALITDKTNVHIRSSEEEVVLFCPQCGHMQEKIQSQCTACRFSLPVKFLD